MLKQALSEIQGYAQKNKYCNEYLISDIINKAKEGEECFVMNVNTFFNTPIEGWTSDLCTICESKNEYPRYKQALDKVEKNIKEVCENCENQNTKWCNKDCSEFVILDIIKKVRGM